MASLKTSYSTFCNSVKKDSVRCNDKTLKKICTDCKIYVKGLDANRVDIEFRGHLLKNRDVDFAGFVQFIEGRLGEAYSKAKGIEKAAAVEEIKTKIANGAPAGHGTTHASKDAATARMTDTSKYTGAHKERFGEDGKGKGLDGREDRVENTGYTGQYKNQDTYDKKH